MSFIYHIDDSTRANITSMAAELIGEQSRKIASCMVHRDPGIPALIPVTEEQSRKIESYMTHRDPGIPVLISLTEEQRAIYNKDYFYIWKELWNTYFKAGIYRILNNTINE